MNEADRLLEFLAEHQPLVVHDEELKQKLLAQFEEAIDFFAKIRDARSVPLILGFFGEGDGYGIYQLAEEAIGNQDPEVVIPALRNALRSEHRSVREWAAELSSLYTDSSLLEPLVALFQEENYNAKSGALIAIKRLQSPKVRGHLEMLAATERDPEIKKEIEEVLKQL